MAIAILVRPCLFVLSPRRVWLSITGHEHPIRRSQLAFKKPNMAGNQLQRVERRQKIPFRPDPGRSRSERVGLLAQFPRERAPPARPAPPAPRTKPSIPAGRSWGRTAFGELGVRLPGIPFRSGEANSSRLLHQGQVHKQQQGRQAGQAPPRGSRKSGERRAAHVSPPRRNAPGTGRSTGTLAAMSVPTLVAK